MTPKIKPGRPPNFDQIVLVFPQAANKNTLFAFADTIYVSSCDINLPDFLIAHETVHLERQGWNEQGAYEWWDKYLKDHDFRYHEELLGHRAEYERITKFNTSRPFKRRTLKEIAKRLTNPLYKFTVSREQAAQDLLGE